MCLRPASHHPPSGLSTFPAPCPGPAPATTPTAIPVQWLVATAPESCDVTCVNRGGCDCNSLQALSGASSASATQSAFNLAGFICNAMFNLCDSASTGQTHVDPNACISWGAPYLHASLPAACFYGNTTAPCNVLPADSQHRRLCPCNGAPPPPPLPSVALPRPKACVRWSLLTSFSTNINHPTVTTDIIESVDVPVLQI